MNYKVIMKKKFYYLWKEFIFRLWVEVIFKSWIKYENGGIFILRTRDDKKCFFVLKYKLIKRYSEKVVMMKFYVYKEFKYWR